jgi:hypothetical protein
MSGSAFSQLGMAAMGLIGLVSVLRGSRNKHKTDEDAETRTAQKMEMERRMASYLAARDDTTTQGARDDRR